MGKSCVLIGNGPSLRNIDMSSLKNVDTLSFNRAYLSYGEDWGFNPTYYCVIDGNTIRTTTKDIIKMVETNKDTKGFFVNNCKGEFDFSSVHDSRFSQIKGFGGKFNSKLFNSNSVIPKEVRNIPLITNVSSFGIQLLYSLGYENIGIIGCDAKYVKRDDVKTDGVYTSGPLKGKPKIVFTSDEDPNHYRSDYHGASHQTSSHHLKGIDGNDLSYWNNIKQSLSKINNINVYSCTEGSRINGILPYKPFDEFRKEYL